MAKPVPWSHSALESFITCPMQFSEVRVLKHFKDEKNAASIWGDQFHRAAEQYCRGTIKALPPDMIQYEKHLDEIIDMPGQSFYEQQYALNMFLQPCGNFDPDVWCRGIVDVLKINGTVARVRDHKTGKNRKKDMQQLIIFALLVFHHHPEVQTCHVQFDWLLLNAFDPETFYRHQMRDMWATLIPKLTRYKKAFNMGVFEPKPSGLCRKHCPVTTCEYHGRGRR